MQTTFLSGLLTLLSNKRNINLSNIHVSLKTHAYICTYMLLNDRKKLQYVSLATMIRIVWVDAAYTVTIPVYVTGSQASVSEDVN